MSLFLGQCFLKPPHSPKQEANFRRHLHLSFHDLPQNPKSLQNERLRYSSCFFPELNQQKSHRVVMQQVLQIPVFLWLKTIKSALRSKEGKVAFEPGIHDMSASEAVTSDLKLLHILGVKRTHPKTA